MLTVYHGATEKHTVLSNDSWVTTSIDEAALYAFMRSYERKQEMFIAKMEIDPEVFKCAAPDLGLFYQNGQLLNNIVVDQWYSKSEFLPLLSPVSVRLLLDTTQILTIDLTKDLGSQFNVKC